MNHIKCVIKSRKIVCHGSVWKINLTSWLDNSTAVENRLVGKSRSGLAGKHIGFTYIEPPGGANYQFQKNSLRFDQVGTINFQIDQCDIFQYRKLKSLVSLERGDSALSYRSVSKKEIRQKKFMGLRGVPPLVHTDDTRLLDIMK